VGPRANLDGQKFSTPTGIRSPDRPARSSIAIPTELPGPPRTEIVWNIYGGGHVWKRKAHVDMHRKNMILVGLHIRRVFYLSDIDGNLNVSTFFSRKPPTLNCVEIYSSTNRRMDRVMRSRGFINRIHYSKRQDLTFKNRASHI
jgi:hypothetical protein